jgi:hypothetical protein
VFLGIAKFMAKLALAVAALFAIAHVKWLVLAVSWAAIAGCLAVAWIMRSGGEKSKARVRALFRKIHAWRTGTRPLSRTAKPDEPHAAPDEPPSDKRADRRTAKPDEPHAWPHAAKIEKKPHGDIG